MKDGLYHKEIGMPSGAILPWMRSEFELVYSEHAKREASSDRYGLIPMLDIVEFASHEVIEVEISQGKPVKAVLRIPCPEVSGVDMILVLKAPESTDHSNMPSALVKTVWFNRSDDRHHTLNRRLYNRP